MVRHSSALTTYNPFLDEYGLIRVSSRLGDASIAYGTSHPVVLPSKNIVTKRIFEYEHQRLLHVGPQALLAHLSKKY